MSPRVASMNRVGAIPEGGRDAEVTGPFGFGLSSSLLSSFLLHPFSLVPHLPLTGLSPFSHQQELVNLLLTGKAVSNVFNDVVELDSGDGNITLLKGIATRSDIGFLSLFEHYNVCQVPSAWAARAPGNPAPGTSRRERKESSAPVPRARASLNHRGFGKSAASPPCSRGYTSHPGPADSMKGTSTDLQCDCASERLQLSCVCVCVVGKGFFSRDKDLKS